MDKIRVTVWHEFRHERHDGSAKDTYPNGIHAVIKEFLDKNDGLKIRVLDMHTIKPIDKDIIVKAAKETGAIVTAEEHNIIGGLGSAVCEAVCEAAPVPVVRVGVNDTFGRSGKVPPLLEMYGLTAQNIAENAKKAVALK